MRKSNQSTKRFAFERLELRTVLNGTVLATGAGGTLTLTGDSNKNAIVVHQISTNSDGSGAIIQVLGAGTKINNLDTPPLAIHSLSDREPATVSLPSILNWLAAVTS